MALGSPSQPVRWGIPKWEGGDGLADIMGQKFSIDVNSGGTES